MIQTAQNLRYFYMLAEGKGAIGASDLMSVHSIARTSPYLIRRLVSFQHVEKLKKKGQAPMFFFHNVFSW